MVKIRKHTSKRVTCRKKYSVTKKVADHKRKVKKEMRKMKVTGIEKPMQRPVGIPNAFPGKGEMLDEFEKNERMQAQMRKDSKSYNLAMKKVPDGELQNYPETIKAPLIIQGK